jgi:hypothetical protein
MKNAIENLRTGVILIASFLAVCPCSAHGQIRLCKLPTQLGRTLADYWKGWSPLQFDDLRPEDQALWQKKWGNACPGLVKGHFVHSGKLAYALSLIDRKNDEQLILAVPAKDGTFKTLVLVAPSKVAAFSVVYALPPGKYPEVETGRTVQTKLDSIAYETIEAGMMMFYEEKGSFRSVVLSE